MHLREALTKKKAAQRRSLWFPCPRRPCLGIPGTIGTRMRHLSTNSTQTGDSMLHCFFSRTPPPHKSASGARCSSSLLDHLPTHTLEPRKLRLGNVLRSARAKKVLHSSLVGSLSKRWAPRPQIFKVFATQGLTQPAPERFNRIEIRRARRDMKHQKLASLVA